MGRVQYNLLRPRNPEVITPTQRELEVESTKLTGKARRLGLETGRSPEEILSDLLMQVKAVQSRRLEEIRQIIKNRQ